MTKNEYYILYFLAKSGGILFSQSYDNREDAVAFYKLAKKSDKTQKLRLTKVVSKETLVVETAY